MRVSRGWARRSGGGNRKEWGGGGISFVAIVSVNMGKGVAKLGSNLRKKNNQPDRQNQVKFYFGDALLSWWIVKLHMGAGQNQFCVPRMHFHSLEFLHAICRPENDSVLQKNQTKCLTRPLTKAAFYKITPHRPPSLHYNPSSPSSLQSPVQRWANSL